MTPSDSLPQDLAAAHAMILAQREMLAEEQALRVMLQSEAKVWALEIERLKLMLVKAWREQFGQSSERSKQLIEQLELAIADLEKTQAEEETKAEIAASEALKEKPTRTGGRRTRRPLPDNLPRERIVYPAPCACGKCGGSRLRKLGEVVTSSRSNASRAAGKSSSTCAKNSLAGTAKASPSRRRPRIRSHAGPSLLAMILASEFLLHQRLNR
jgi:transposase